MLPKILTPVFLTLLFAITACDEAGWEPGDGSDGGDGGGGNGGGGGETAFFGPDDVWELTMEDDNSFSLTRKDDIDDDTPQMNIVGTYERLNTGFTRFTANNEPVGVNEIFAGLEIGDDTVLLSPVRTPGTQISALIRSGTCPDAIVDGGWIKFRFADAADPTSADYTWFGTWRYNPDPSTSETPVFAYRDDYDLVDMSSTAGGSERDSTGCDRGLASSDTHSDYLSETFSVVSVDKDTAANNEYVLGFPSTDVTSSAEYNGQYIGFMYEGFSNNFQPVSASCTAGDCQVYSVIDIASVTNSSQIFTLSFGDTTDQPEDGFITGTWEDTLSTQTANIACGVTLNVDTVGNDFLACVAQYPAATVTDAANLFLISTD